jgi:hypothetical protein
LPLPIAAAISIALPSTIAIAVALIIGHCCLCHYQPLQLPSQWPSPLLLPLAIAKSCCLGVAGIVFKQFEQIIFTLFYLVWTVGGALIKAG